MQALYGVDHGLWLNGHLPGANSADLYGPYPVMEYVNALPPTRYTGNMGYDDPPHPATVPAEQQRNQNQFQFDGNRTPGNPQYIPIAPGPPRLEQHAPAIPEVPNDARHVPGENPSFVHPVIPVAEDLKNLAGHYLHNRGSRVDEFRMRRSRSGAVKVLILLEIDDTM
ncbi:hypothetical protein BJV77DRAFT_1067499 [Russula vinacea]|nr:hypothetical protein BJV77DRAFT_1067499 [Russula vinacea]